MRSALEPLGDNLKIFWARNERAVESRNYDRLLFAAENAQMRSTAAVSVLKVIKYLGGDLVTESLEMMSWLQSDRGGYNEVSPNIRQVDGKPVLFLGFEGDQAVYVPVDTKDFELEIGESSLDALFSVTIGEEFFCVPIPIAKKMEKKDSHTKVNADFVNNPDWANRVRPLPCKSIRTIKLAEYKNTEQIEIIGLESNFREKDGRGFVFATITLENGDILTSWNNENTSPLFKSRQGRLFVRNSEIVGGKKGRVSLGDIGPDYTVVNVYVRTASKDGKSFELADVVVNHPEIGYTSLSLGMDSSDALMINIKSIMAHLDKITEENPIVVRNSIVSVPESIKPKSKTPALNF